ncbi:MAG: hypothetical protein ABW158_06035 [Candidatus Thiodiazotropha sp. 6PDIVS]
MKKSKHDGFSIYRIFETKWFSIDYVVTPSKQPMQKHYHKKSLALLFPLDFNGRLFKTDKWKRTIPLYPALIKKNVVHCMVARERSCRFFSLSHPPLPANNPSSDYYIVE